MEKRALYRTFGPLLLVVTMLTLGSCGTSLSGKYSNSALILTFESGNKVLMSSPLMPAVVTELDYTIEGDKLKLKTPQGPAMILSILPDGSIQGPTGGQLVKAKD